ncbi:MAG: thiamine pyrophosphate-binding protein [Acidobacteriota bacterium]|nr:thiamine pyrophosphate-binding protein [Acidobacteriota bacterium]
MSDTAPSCAAVLARTLREAGITRMFGLPGGEILDFIHAARREGIEFLLTRHEGAASFMADVTGQIQRRPGVCVATLGLTSGTPFMATIDSTASSDPSAFRAGAELERAGSQFRICQKSVTDQQFANIGASFHLLRPAATPSSSAASAGAGVDAEGGVVKRPS